MGDLTIKLLGGLTVSHTGRPVTGLRALKARALLAYLAVERGQAHSRSHLGRLFWPDQEPAAARTSLRQALFQLRRVLESPGDTRLFVTDRETVRWNPEVALWLDMAAFLSPATGSGGALDPATESPAILEQRAALYRGPFLAEFPIPPPLEAFREWLEGQRTFLHRLALQLVGRLSRHYEAGGDLATALRYARRHVALDPGAEEGHRLVMRILARQGETNAALRQYERCRETLYADLGVLPEETTDALRDRILDGRVGSETGVPTLADCGEPVLAAERRQVTILACDYQPRGVMDPEERARLLGRLLERAASHVQGWGGHYLRPHGGTLLAYFGFPAAREEASRDALEAAMALREEPDAAEALRVGIHAETIITGTDHEVPDPAGLATEQAMEARNRAAPGEIVVTSRIRTLTSAAFRFEPLTGDLFRLEGRSARESGVEKRSPTPFVGRERELGTLWRHVRDTRAGREQLVLVRGEAGVGKTSLLEAVRRRLAAQGDFVIHELRCRSETHSVPFGPVTELLARRLGAGGKPDPAVAQRFLDTHLEELPNPDATRLLGRLLGQSDPDRAHRDPDPRRERLRIQETCLQIVTERAARQPVLILLEDLHWADSGTRDLVNRLPDAVRDLPVLVLASSRSGEEVTAPRDWTFLDLPPLDARTSRTLLTALESGTPLPDAVRTRILERAEGIPLFLEELIRTYRDTPAAAEGDSQIPATLQELLWARLEVLGPAKRIAQLAATLDREFSEEWLAAITTLDRASLAGHLRRLVEAGILEASPESRKMGYRFRHALFQQAAYEIQLHRDRRAAHRRIVEVLQERFPETARERPQLVARHAASGELPDTALEAWIQAGWRALDEAAHREALEHFAAAEALAERTPWDDTRKQRELSMHLGGGLASLALHGYGSAEADRSFRRALRLLRPGTDECSRFQILWGLWLGASSHSGYEEAKILSGHLLEIAERLQEPALRTTAHLAAGNTRFMTGAPEQALTHLDTAVAAYRPEDHDFLVRSFGENPAITGYAFRSWPQSLLGHTAAAAETMNVAIDRAREVDHPPTLAFVLTFAAMGAFFLRDGETAGEWAEEVLQLAERYRFRLWEASGSALYGWARVARGHADGMAPLERSLEGMRKAMSGAGTAFLALLGDAHLRLGNREPAIRAFEEAQATIGRVGDVFYKPEILRMRGRLAEDTPWRAGALFREAAALARAQGALLWELRAATELARLDGPENGARLAETLGRFPDGAAGPDVREARRLMADRVGSEP
ncbi:AAA family ATPase [Thiohalorhabdus sp. Cl-TMA]|uniref:AAA family ATPase n=1 Tax=Thiohalorhabdus methylotrophus TaxID=3242694 RepID=A0ABV4TX35_9GAMM